MNAVPEFRGRLTRAIAVVTLVFLSEATMATGVNPGPAPDCGPGKYAVLTSTGWVCYPLPPTPGGGPTVINATPEPDAWWMLLGGAGVVIGALVRKRHKEGKVAQ